MLNYQLCHNLISEYSKLNLHNGAYIWVASRLRGYSDVRITLDAYGTFQDQLMMADVGMIREKFSENNS
jgi:hypothetical protein